MSSLRDGRMEYPELVLRFQVLGSPMNRGKRGAKEQEWLDRCVEAARNKLDPGTALPLERAVKMVFRVRFPCAPPGYELDNVFKPLIDALGTILFRPRTKGHNTRRDPDDRWVFEIDARKELESGDPGIDVEVWTSKVSLAEPRCT